jgi:hypothetical protein
VCSCLGAHHGEGHPGGRWYIVSETCAVRWKNAEWYWSRLTAKENHRKRAW